MERSWKPAEGKLFFTPSHSSSSSFYTHGCMCACPTPYISADDILLLDKVDDASAPQICKGEGGCPYRKQENSSGIKQ